MAFGISSAKGPQRTNRSGWKYIDEHTLKTKLLAAFSEHSQTRLICDVGIYRGRSGSWRIGHIRLNNSSEICWSEVAAIEASFREAYRLTVK